MLRRAALPALFVSVLLLAYRGGLGRDFTSEDFLILRRLGTGGFFERAAEGWSGPWLGAGFAPFYRPFSSLLLQLELLAFGIRPLPYLLLHLAIHAGCAWLLTFWLRQLLPAASRFEIAAAALVFVLYPLHPNTVLFVASFATLFATLFVLATLGLEAAGHRAKALALTPLALFSYEQAVVLPALVLLFDLATRPGNWRQRLRLWPYFAITAAYLLVRSALLRDLGGYSGFRDRLSDPAGLLASLGEVMSRLFVPFFTVASGNTLTYVVAGGLALLTALALGSRKEPGARLLLAGLVAIPLVQAPFFFTGVVPGNGRYFYLASALVALVVWQGLCLVLRPLAIRTSLPVVALALLAAALLCASGLFPVVAIYDAAAQRCLAIRAALEGAPPGRLFVAGRPLFAYAWGVPVAQVFHWGLADALEPPFTGRTDLMVYPLPELADKDLAPLLGQPALGRVYRLGEGDRLVPLVAPEILPARLDIRRDDASSPFLRVRPLPGTTMRLIVLTQGGPSVLALPAPPRGGEEILAEVPAATRKSMRYLYGTPLFFWVEARGQYGELIAASEIIEL